MGGKDTQVLCCAVGWVGLGLDAVPAVRATRLSKKEKEEMKERDVLVAYKDPKQRTRVAHGGEGRPPLEATISLFGNNACIEQVANHISDQIND